MKKIVSKVRDMGFIHLPTCTVNKSMIPFSIVENDHLGPFKKVVKNMLEGIFLRPDEVAYFTAHGMFLDRGQTLRRPGPHIDGNYLNKSWGSDWKVGGDGTSLTAEEHEESYHAEGGGIILASTYALCQGWKGVYEGEPGTGGDCSHLDLGEPFRLAAHSVYYGNSRFIHESLPAYEPVHRTIFRITLPSTHKYQESLLEDMEACSASG